MIDPELGDNIVDAARQIGRPNIGPSKTPDITTADMGEDRSGPGVHGRNRTHDPLLAKRLGWQGSDQGKRANVLVV